MKTPGRVRRRNKISGQFSARIIEMMELVAFRVLSHSARRVLDRLEIEHAHHGGHDNGTLPVTFNDFANYGIDRHAITPALRESEALGFARVTERGRAGNAEFRSPNKFALTYRATKDAPETNDWKRIATRGGAGHRKSGAKTDQTTAPRKTESQWGYPHISVWETHTENQNPQWGKPPLQGKCVNPHYYLYLGVGAPPPYSPPPSRIRVERARRRFRVAQRSNQEEIEI